MADVCVRIGSNHSVALNTHQTIDRLIGFILYGASARICIMNGRTHTQVPHDTTTRTHNHGHNHHHKMSHCRSHIITPYLASATPSNSGTTVARSSSFAS
eukprot:450165_1